MYLLYLCIYLMYLLYLRIYLMYYMYLRTYCTNAFVAESLCTAVCYYTYRTEQYYKLFYQYYAIQDCTNDHYTVLYITVLSLQYCSTAIRMLYTTVLYYCSTCFPHKCRLTKCTLDCAKPTLVSKCGQPAQKAWQDVNAKLLVDRSKHLIESMGLGSAYPRECDRLAST